MKTVRQDIKLWVVLWIVSSIFILPALAQGQSVLNFPVILSAAEMSTHGFAVVNPGVTPATVTFTLYGAEGTPVSTTSREISPGGQIASLASELFANPSGGGWAQATSSTPGLSGIWLGGDFATYTDGAPAAEPAADLVFPALTPATIINLANTESSSTVVRFVLRSGNGSDLATATTVILGRGAYHAPLQLMFPSTDLSRAQSLRATAFGGAIAGVSVLFGVGQGTLECAVLNALNTAQSMTALNFPHAISGVLGASNYSTIVALTNMSSTPQSVTLTFNPEPSGPPVVVSRNLPANGGMQDTIENVFGISGVPTASRDGWLQITGQSPLGGALIYSDLSGGGIASVPAQTAPLTQFTFAHVAGLPDWYTGVALLNAMKTAANVEVSAFTPKGIQVGSTWRFTLAAGHKRADILSNWIPEAATQNAGYVVVRTTNGVPLYGLELFGSTSGKTLTNVAASTLQGISSLPAAAAARAKIFTANQPGIRAYNVRAEATKRGNPSDPEDFGNGVLFEVYKHPNSGADIRLWSTVFARPNTALINLLVDLDQNEYVYRQSAPLTADSPYDDVTLTTVNAGPARVSTLQSVSPSVSPNDGKTAAIRALIRMAEQIAGADRVEVVLPQGDYYLDAPASGSFFLQITGSNITLRGTGAGARLIAKSANYAYVRVDNGSNVNIENIIFDTEQAALPFVQGKVQSVDGSRINVTLDWTPADSSRFITNTEGTLLGHSYRNTDPGLNAESVIYIASANLTTTNGVTTMTLVVAGMPAVSVNEYIVVKRTAFFPFASYAIRYQSTTDGELRNVIIRSSPGVGVVCTGTNGMHFDGYRVEKAPTIGGQIDRLISTNLDAIHYQFARRGPTVEDSFMTGMGDDGINIYTSIMDLSVRSPSTFTRSGLGDLRVGDVLLVYKWVNNRSQPEEMNHVKVTALAESGGTGTVTVAGVSPADVLPNGANLYVNLSARGEGFILRNNIFSRCRCRGAHIQTGFGIISGNQFIETTEPGIDFIFAIALAEPGRFKEGAYPRDIITSGNRFEKAGYAHPISTGDYLMAIRFFASRFVSPLPDPMYRNVAGFILGNTFKGQRANDYVWIHSVVPGAFAANSNAWIP